jgi:beta-RFAP synthase
MSDEQPRAGPRLPQGTLLEGIVTTLDADGSPHIAPMGPIVDAAFERLLLRPYRSSTTYQNLKRTGQGVLHVCDDVELLARAAVGRLDPLPPLARAEAVEGVILTDACRWYAFHVESIDDRQERTDIVARVVDRGRLRDFFGFNRAKHAVIEAAILTTRLDLLEAEHVRVEFDRLAVLVDKTGGQQERRAFNFLREYLAGSTRNATDQILRSPRPAAKDSTEKIDPSPLSLRAPCRLHFGMFSFGRADRPQFGGVGMMIEPPAVEVTVEAAQRFSVAGPHASRVQQFAGAALQSWGLTALPACQLRIDSPPDHVGLGVGTQLGLAVAAALRRFLQLPDLPIDELARATGRGSRSAVGTHGFERGGLIVDAGKRTGDHLGKLAHRVAVPDAWRIVLVCPTGEHGLAGPSEADAFARLPPVPDATTHELWQIAEQEMLPAIERIDCEQFGDAVYRFGRLAGECFKSVQGGPFASSAVAQMVDAIRRFGVAGVGQSSWGPTVFAIVANDSEAERLEQWLRSVLRVNASDLAIARPNNRGRRFID